MHWLICALLQVDNGQTTVAKAQTSIRITPITGRVWATRHHAVAHPAHGGVHDIPAVCSPE
jgi:hypothetical protein